MTTHLIVLNATNCGCFVAPLFIIGILCLCLFGIFITTPMRQRKQLRTQFKQKKQEYLLAQETYLEKIKNGFYGDKFPFWAVQSVQKFSTKLTAQKKKFTPNQEFFDTFDKESDIHIMETFLEDLSNYNHFLTLFLSDFSKIEEEIKRVQHSIEQTITHIQQRLDGLTTSLVEHEKTGYILQKYNVQYALLKTEFSQAKTLQKSRPSGDKEIQSLLADLLERTGEIEKNLYDFVQYRDKTDTLLSNLRDRYLALYPMKEAADIVLTSLKNTYPETCWANQDDNFDFVPSLLEEYLSFMDIAQIQNMMSVQNFEFALAAAQTAESKLELMEQFVADVHACRENIEEAKSNYHLLLTSTSKAISAAGLVAKTGSDESKNLFAQADEKLNQAVHLSSQPLVDWLALADMLAEAKSLAERCTAQTKN